jgi:drug/metabolite transporter (DMT)-like permease
MKTFTLVFTLIAIALIIFNATKIDFDSPFEGQSIVALITIFALLCAIVLLQILRLSKRVQKKLKNRN